MTDEPQQHEEGVQASEMKQDIGEVTPESIKETLKRVIDPELHMNIVDLGLVYSVKFKEEIVSIDMTLTSPGCPFGPYIMHQVTELAKSIQGVEDVQLEIVWEPLWGPEKMTEEARLELGFDV